MPLPTPIRLTDSPLPAYAWPGGYPILYLSEFNEILCPTCASDRLNTNLRADLLSALGFETTDVAWTRDELPSYGDCYWEGPPLPCDECSTMIESAYGDPDSPEDD